MLFRVTAKNVGDVFLRHSVYFQQHPKLQTIFTSLFHSVIHTQPL